MSRPSGATGLLFRTALGTLAGVVDTAAVAAIGLVERDRIGSIMLAGHGRVLEEPPYRRSVD